MVDPDIIINWVLIGILTIIGGLTLWVMTAMGFL